MNVPAIVFGGLAGVSAVATVWFAVETVLLIRDPEHAITWYVRNYTSWHPGVFSVVIALLAFTFGAAVAHFVWDQAVHALRDALR